MEHIAQSLNKVPIEVKRLNFYKNGDKMITGQTIDHCTIADLTEKFLTSSAYKKRLDDAGKFNANNRWRKRGISVTPMKYGAGWNGNKYNCHVSVWRLL